MKLLFSVSILMFMVLPMVVAAQTGGYVPLVGIPGIEPGSGIAPYLAMLYVLSISIAAFLAVARLIWAGLQYILSDIVTKKETAKTQIRNTLIGLLLVIGAVFVLNIINPSLTNLTALQGIQGVSFVEQRRAEVIATANDAADIQTNLTMCEARRSEGYVFRVYGPPGNQSYECCIPGINCVYNTATTTQTGINIDTGKIYSNEEVQDLRQELQQTGKLLYFTDVILSTHIAEDENRCRAQGGTPYQIQKKVPNVARNQVHLACMDES